MRSSRAGVDVVQHDLVERRAARACAQQRAVDERDAEAAAADDRELHECDRISMPPIAFT